MLLEFMLLDIFENIAPFLIKFNNKADLDKTI